MKRRDDSMPSIAAETSAEFSSLLAGETRSFNFQVAYAGLSDPGRVRLCNEDSFLILEDEAIFAVADGLGGLDAGDVASRTALEALAALCRPAFSGAGEEVASPAGGEKEADLGSLVDAVNVRVFERKTALGNTMATTLALVSLSDDAAWIAHVGDSRVYLWREGLLRRLTNDHSLVMELYEKGVLSATEMQKYPRRHVITRAIGAGATVAAEVQHLDIAPSDVLLLCTDGLSAMLADQVICDFLRDSAGDTITGIATRLVDAANAAGGHDNITLILIKIC